MDIVDSIDRFINSRMYNYALMIDGKWGCGKTFYIKNKVIPHLEEKFVETNEKKGIIYLSLFGVNNIDEINRMMYTQLLGFTKLDKLQPLLKTKVGQIATRLGSIAVNYELTNFSANYDDIYSIIDVFSNIENMIIILDDLERSGCNIGEVFGYINGLVEHSDASVVLVANESEIRNNDTKNDELKTLLAIDNRIKINEKDYMSSVEKAIYLMHKNNSNDESSDKTFSIESMNKRKKMIFGSNEEYKRIKEKIIGQTIYYEPELSECYKSIINGKIKNSIIKNKLITQIDNYVTIAEKEQHNNLRTFQFFLEKSNIVFDIIKEDYGSLRGDILEYIFRCSIHYMKGLQLPQWSMEYGYVIFDDRNIFAQRYLGFKFIDDLITNNTISVENVTRVLTDANEFLLAKGQLSDDPLQLIKEWWNLDDGTLKKYLSEIKSNVQNKKYSVSVFPEILSYVSYLKAYNIFVEICDEIISEMSSYDVSSEQLDLQEVFFDYFGLDPEIKSIYLEGKNKIVTGLNDLISDSEKNQFVNAINDRKHWASNLLEVSRKQQGYITRSFIIWIPRDILIDLIKESDNKELYIFRSALRCYYDDLSIYSKKQEDLETLKLFECKLKEIPNEEIGAIKKQIIKWIIEDIDKYLKEIQSSLLLRQ